MAKEPDRPGPQRAPEPPSAHEDRPALPGAPARQPESPPGDQPVTLAAIGDRLLSLAGTMKAGHMRGQQLHDELLRLGGAAKSGGRI